jgi:hypothetical protein
MAVDKDLLIVMNTIDETRDHMSEGQYLKTCDALRRVHKKLNSPKVPLPKFNSRFTLKCFYMFSYAVSVVKVIDGIKRVVTR